MTQVVDESVLTIGIICRNGEKHINMAMNSALAVVQTRPTGTTHITLVDSGSDDSSGDLMKSFAQNRPFAAVISITGDLNAAVARNAVLDDATNGHVFMVDGDVDIDPDFVQAAIREIEGGHCDAAYGQLPEFWYGVDETTPESKPDRYRVNERHFPGWFKGVVVLGNSIRESGLRYDERFERLEDIEFSLRVCDQFKTVALPIRMGVHHTSGYHTAGRLKDFIGNSYQRPVGHLLKRYWRSPGKLWRVRRAYIGYAYGLSLLTGIAVGLLLQLPWLLAICLIIAIADLIRFTYGGRLFSFVPLRIVGPIQILLGLLSRLPPEPKYTITKI